jgi:rhodanese-related sulfurtransferase
MTLVTRTHPRLQRQWFAVMPLTAALLSCMMPLWSSAVAASESSPVASLNSGPYCGVYSLYAASKLTGKNVGIRSLLKTKYVSDNGSTIAQLERAANDLGLNSLPLSQVMGSALEDSPYLMILHVKSSVGARDYDHWLLYLGAEHGMARVLDAPKDIQEVSFSDLAAIWDGSGLAVSSGSINPARIRRLQQRRILVYGFVFALTLVSAHLFRRFVWRRRGAPYAPTLKNLAVRTAAVMSAAVAVALAYHRTAQGGVLRQAELIDSIQRAHFQVYRELSAAEVATLPGEAVVIDARLSNDFDEGHLPRARSIPVNTSVETVRHVLAGVSKDAPIVIYCQSMGCPFARRVASVLAGEHFNNIAIYPGGWMDWQKQHPQPVVGSSPTTKTGVLN